MQYIIAEETKGVLNMREYVTPRMTGETFASNEYISVCWGVACAVNDANEYEASIHNSAQDHREAYCGTIGHQWLVDDDDNGTPESMQEISTDGLGSLACTIYTDGTYRWKDNIAEVKVGDYIYWTTSAGSGRDKRTWHHQGWVTATTPGHPNRS